jgi:hypothetical protein
VATLETATAELDAQQDTLSSAVERVDLANTELHHRIDHANNTTNRRWPQGDNPNDNQAGDDVQTFHKLEFPKFDGSGDPLSWINRCERFF